MGDDPGGVALAAGSLDELLLDAKLSVPQPRPDAVSRSALIDGVRASSCRVVGVTAPAGYGKSTLLAQWAHADDRRVAWLSLDRFDDDPAALVRVLAAAFARVSSGSADLVADVGGAGVSVLGRAAPRLAAALRTSPEPFVLMVDDLHELRSPACHDVLEVVLSGIPAGSQVAAASRADQPHLARLRASGEALELVAGDLALDATAAGHIFSQARVSLTPELAASLVERTEGWAVGIHLAALIAGDDPGKSVTISGDDRYVADYLYRESLMQLPPDTQRFLCRTAVLEQLCAPLCDAVLGTSGAQERLRALEASSLFLVPLDRRRAAWYRYHALFREFLLGELRRVEPEVIPELHLRAADWYEANGSSAMALEHLLHTAERDRCGRLVAAFALPTFQAGRSSTVQRWFEALGDPAIEAHPPLAVLACWMAALAGQTAQALRWAAVLDATSYDVVPPDGAGAFEVVRAMLRAVMCAHGPEQALADARFAVAREPAWSPWRGVALYGCAEAHLLAGDVGQATVLFAEFASADTASANPGALIITLSELAILAIDRGRWTEADELVVRALAVIDDRRMQDYAISALAFAAAARLAVHRGDLDGANGHFTKAMRVRPSCTAALPALAVRVRLQMAKVAWTTDDPTTARHLLREIDDILLHRPSLGTLVAEVSELRRMLQSSRPGRAGAPPLTPAELRLLPYLQTHLTIREIAERLFVSRNTVNTELGSIYRKLGVTTRNGAVERSTSMGLLGG